MAEAERERGVTRGQSAFRRYHGRYWPDQTQEMSDRAWAALSPRAVAAWEAAGTSPELEAALLFCRSFLAQGGPRGAAAAAIQTVIDYLTGTAVPGTGQAEDERVDELLSRQCCPMDTYGTDSAGDLRPVCTCDNGCACMCAGCACDLWGEEDDDL